MLSLLLFVWYDVYLSSYVFSVPLSDDEVVVFVEEDAEALACVVAILPEPDVAVGVVVDAVAVAASLVEFAYVLVAVLVAYGDEAVVVEVFGVEDLFLFALQDVFHASCGEAVVGVVVGCADGGCFFGYGDAEEEFSVAELSDDLSAVVAHEHAVAVEEVLVVDLSDVLSALCGDDA